MSDFYQLKPEVVSLCRFMVGTRKCYCNLSRIGESFSGISPERLHQGPPFKPYDDDVPKHNARHQSSGPVSILASNVPASRTKHPDTRISYLKEGLNLAFIILLTKRKSFWRRNIH